MTPVRPSLPGLALTALLAAVFPLPAVAGEAAAGTADDGFSQEVLAQDRALFAAFNTCDLETWRRYLAEDVEFYQDNDDVTTTRSELEPSFVDRCDAAGNPRLRRELVAESVEVHAIQGYGAVQLGSHRFYLRGDDGEERLVATPRFVHLWRQRDGAWQITRVISYDH